MYKVKNIINITNNYKIANNILLNIADFQKIYYLEKMMRCKNITL